MKKRFILAIDSPTEEETKAFQEGVVKELGWWWHWISNAWLLSNAAADVSAAQIRDLANLHFPGVNKIVLEMRDDGTDTWSGYGPTKPERDMFKWIKENWKKSEQNKRSS